MVIKNDPRKVLDLMGTKHREADPDDEFLDRLAKKASFFDQPSAPPETLNLPSVGGEEDGQAAGVAAAALDALADVKVEDDKEEENDGPRLLHVAAPDSAEAEAALKQQAEHEKKAARYAALFEGRSAGGSDMTSAPEDLKFSRISMAPQQHLPEVGTTSQAATEEELLLQKEDEERRAAYIEMYRQKEQDSKASELHSKAHERFVATFGHRGAELKE